METDQDTLAAAADVAASERGEARKARKERELQEERDERRQRRRHRLMLPFRLVENTLKGCAIACAFIVSLAAVVIGYCIYIVYAFFSGRECLTIWDYPIDIWWWRPVEWTERLGRRWYTVKRIGP